MAELNFDASQFEPKVGGAGEPLPAGRYMVAITESEESPNKSATGTYLKLTLQVCEGEHEGRKVFRYLNLNHPKPGAVKVAQGELSAICHAIGIGAIRDSVELHDKPFVAELLVKAGSGGYGPSNDVKAYHAASGAKPPAAPAAGSSDDDEIPF